MTEEECAIIDFLRRSPETLFARKEIARKATRRSVYEENPHWADQALASLVAKDVADIDDGGFYRFKKYD